MADISNLQLYIAVAIPTAASLTSIAVALSTSGRLEARLDGRIDSLRADMDRKFDATRDLIDRKTDSILQILATNSEKLGRHDERLKAIEDKGHS